MPEEENSSEEAHGLIYYTPVDDPTDVRKIAIEKEEKLHALIDFIEKNTKKKRSPDIEEYSSSGLHQKVGVHVEAVRGSFPDVSEESVRQLFEVFSSHAYGRSRTEERHWCVILSEKFFFVYHFTPGKGYSFEGDEITEFIKYLDDSTLNRFIFLTQKRFLENFYDVDTEEYASVDDTADLSYTYDRADSKGFRDLTSTSPVYDQKGSIQIRSSHSDSTDVVLETEIGSIPFSDSIKIDFKDNKLEIRATLPIKEYQIDRKKYSGSDAQQFVNHMRYDRLKLSHMLTDLDFHTKAHPEAVTIREDDSSWVLVDEDGERIKRIRKEIGNVNDKHTFSILSQHDLNIDDAPLMKQISEKLQNETGVMLAEVASYSEKYDVVQIGETEVFMKVKEDELLPPLVSDFEKILAQLGGTENVLYRKILTACGIAAIAPYAQRRSTRDFLTRLSQTVLTKLFEPMNSSTPNLSLKEVDSMGIEFKAGDRGNNQGFFDPSAKKFAQKLKGKFGRKRKDLVVFFTGINEDTFDFSPMPQSRMRNEFREDVQSELNGMGVHCPVVIMVPTTSTKGILLTAIQKVQT